MRHGPNRCCSADNPSRTFIDRQRGRKLWLGADSRPPNQQDVANLKGNLIVNYR